MSNLTSSAHSTHFPSFVEVPTVSMYAQAPAHGTLLAALAPTNHAASNPLLTNEETQLLQSIVSSEYQQFLHNVSGCLPGHLTNNATPIQYNAQLQPTSDPIDYTNYDTNNAITTTTTTTTQMPSSAPAAENAYAEFTFEGALHGGNIDNDYDQTMQQQMFQQQQQMQQQMFQQPQQILQTLNPVIPQPIQQQNQLNHNHTHTHTSSDNTNNNTSNQNNNTAPALQVMSITTDKHQKFDSVLTGTVHIFKKTKLTVEVNLVNPPSGVTNFAVEPEVAESKFFTVNKLGGNKFDIVPVKSSRNKGYPLSFKLNSGAGIPPTNLEVVVMSNYLQGKKPKLIKEVENVSDIIFTVFKEKINEKLTKFQRKFSDSETMLIWEYFRQKNQTYMEKDEFEAAIEWVLTIHTKISGVPELLTAWEHYVIFVIDSEMVKNNFPDATGKICLLKIMVSSAETLAMFFRTTQTQQVDNVTFEMIRPNLYMALKQFTHIFKTTGDVSVAVEWIAEPVTPYMPQEKKSRGYNNVAKKKEEPANAAKRQKKKK